MSLAILAKEYQLFTKAYSGKAKLYKAISGFRAAVIHPIVPYKFKDSFKNTVFNQSDTNQTQNYDVH